MTAVLGSLPSELHRVDQHQTRRYPGAGVVERDRLRREADDVRERRRVQRDGCRRVELGRRRRDEREIDSRVVADRHRDVGCERPFVHGVLLSSRSPAASINALRVKSRGRVKAATLLALGAASAASEALTRLRTATECEGRSGGHESCPLRELAALVEAEVAALVADDQVIEQRDDRKSTRLNSSHSQISYAVFCLKKKKEYVFSIAVDELLGT